MNIVIVVIVSNDIRTFLGIFIARNCSNRFIFCYFAIVREKQYI
jgi:hypothetical protein